MSNLLYVVIPIGVFTIVGLLVGLKDRKPRSTESYVDEFNRQRAAMSAAKVIDADDQDRRAQAG
ncbi:MAG: hypothetical protein HKL82_04845 [Acidimicrobiaceae bacterium]|nr:hypothetical protein [Acidimicrobiaceae bacterium]